MTLSTRTLVADDLTPVRAYASLRAADPSGASFLFESVIGGERWGRYSILGYRPAYEAVLTRAGWSLFGQNKPDFSPIAGAKDPLAAAASLFARGDRSAKSPAEKLARAHVGYLAYDLVHLVDKVPPGDSKTWDAHFVPLARFLGGAVIVVFDALAQTVTIAAHDDASVDRALQDLRTPPTLADIALPDRARIPKDVEMDLTDAEYMDRVRVAQEYIAAGDAFQIVLARTFSVPRAGKDPFDVYRAMRVINPSPYMYFLDLPARPHDPSKKQAETERLQIIGASPETLVRLEDGVMTVRPIAGTRPRGKTHEEDEALERELVQDPKERAEHVMLIDLGRNDVGRVAEIGSVRLVKQMEVERYSHVMHLVSEVTGRISADVPPLDVVHAAFPAGTLTGAPKVRAMQIIRELEARPRNIYGGAIGYLSGGDLDFAIAIRTAVCKGDRFEVTAGAGIVHASVPESEADETRNKARGVLCAIEAAPSLG